MSLDTTTLKVGETPTNKSVHIVRITGARCTLSYNKQSMRLALTGTIAEGQCAGFSVDFPPFETMLAERTGTKTASYIAKTRKYLANILGCEAADVTNLPTRAGEVTPLMQMLLNAHIEAEITYEPPREIETPEGVRDMREKWVVNRVIRPVSATEVVPVDWEEYFSWDEPETENA